MRKKIMILGASVLQLPAIQQAKKMGLKVVAVDMDSNAIGFKEADIEVEVISTIDISAVVACAKKHRIDAVMTLASDMPIRTVAAVSKELNLIGISDNTAFFLLGEIIEFGESEKLFSMPKDKRTEDYITGRFG